jgi:hypothetical protein
LELRLMVRTLAAELLGEFRQQSTLDDLPSPERVDALYRLGQLLVYAHWPILERAMDGARSLPMPDASGIDGTAGIEPLLPQPHAQAAR